MEAGRVTTALLATVTAGALGVGAVVGVQAWRSSADPAAAAPAASAAPGPSASSAAPTPTATLTATPTRTSTPTPTRTASPTPTPTRTPTAKPTPKPTPTTEPDPEPVMTPGPALLREGDSGSQVKSLQARLAQIGWFLQRPTDTYGPVTRAAVEGFQAKRGIPVTGEVDWRTMQRLAGMTHRPTPQELDPPVPEDDSGAPLDARCASGRVMCVDKSTNSLRWVVDGDVRMRMDVRFGSDFTPTREGSFGVFAKNANGFSSLYKTPMPYAMTFSGGQAVHYSADFAARGYAGASHGCVNVRDLGAIQALFAEVQIGDRVVVYRS